jgi:hypothetical protein
VYTAPGVGDYLPLVRDLDPNEYQSMIYSIDLRVQFNRFRPGHPNMERYKRWAAAIVAAIRNNYDEQTIWQKARDRYLVAHIGKNEKE